MSHRDSEGHIAPQSHAQDLVRVFEWLLAGLDLSGIGFRRDSHCSPRGLVLMALLWAWSDETTLKRRCTAPQKIAGRVACSHARLRAGEHASPGDYSVGSRRRRRGREHGPGAKP